MEEPTCEIHAFSYSSANSTEATQENPMYAAMEESVSFGRFTSESLSWEKWSAFNRNRHVEEAEKYSRPGSVKQKKAYLEAHFKRMATLKADAAASPDQADTIEEAPSEPIVDETMPKDNHNELHCQRLPIINDQQWIEKEPEIPDFGGNQDEDKLNDEEARSSGIEIAGSDEPVRIQPTGDLIDVEKQNLGAESESELPKMENISLQSSSINQENSAPALVKRNPPLSSYIPSVEADASRISSSSPAKPVVQSPAVHPVTKMDKVSWKNDQDKKRAPFFTLLNRKLGRLVSPVIKKIGNSSKASKKSRLRTTPKENPNNRLCQSFCFGSKLQSNSLNGGRENASPN